MRVFIIISSFVLFLNVFLLIKECLRKTKTNVTYAYILYSVISCIILTASILQRFTTSPFFINIYHQIIAGGLYLTPSILLILYLMFVNTKISNKLFYIPILIFPLFFIVLSLTNDMHHLLYVKYDVIYQNRIMGPLYSLSIIYVYFTILVDYIVLLVANYKKSNILNTKLFGLFWVTLFTITIPILFYCKVITSPSYFPSIILSLNGILSYFIIIRYQYINAVPFGVESAINFINTPICVVDIHGEIVYSNKVFKTFIKNTLGIFLNVDNIFKFLSAFDITLTKELQASLKNIYKVKGSIVKYASLNGLDETINLKITVQEIKKTNYYLLVFRNINQQIKELQDIKSKQSIINVQSQLATIGELALGVVHDINTPINALNTAIELLEQTPLTHKEAEILDNLKSSADKINIITSSIKNQFKNADSSEKIYFDLNTFLNQTLYSIKHKLEDANCSVNLNVPDNINIYGNPSKLSQVVLNILFNSINAYKQNLGGIIYIDSHEDDDYTYIEVKDYAGGIDDKLKPHIFNNILTTKGTKGFGLGLYISNSIIQAEFNGELSFKCIDNSTTITIKIRKKGDL